MPKSSTAAEQPSNTLPETHDGSNVPKRRTLEGQTRTGPSSQYAPTLPPLTGLVAGIPTFPQTIDTGSPLNARPFGVHSILNPTAETEHQRTPQRITQSPRGSISTALGSYQPQLTSPRVRKRKDDISPGRAGQAINETRAARRLLTPKSPALRSLSQGVRSSPSGSLQAHTGYGSTESRFYTIEPGETSGGTVPPLPSLHMRPHGLLSSAPVQENAASAVAPAHSNSSGSYTANPKAHAGSPSGSSNLAEREVLSPFRPPVSDSGQGVLGSIGQGTILTRAYGAGQPAYQIELSTDSGPMIVPVEVDIQQASKLADEKRKRNAGASARFRQRRKEKEHAASQHIADLQRQMRDLTEDREFYLNERNFFRDIFARTPGATLPARAPSPRLRRSQAPGHYATATRDMSPGDEYGRHEIDEPSPAQRRRTSEYQPSFATTPMPPTNYAPSYPASQPPTYTLPPPPIASGLQDPRVQSATHVPASHSHAAHPPPPTLAQGIRHHSYDPFRRDPNPR